MRPVQPNPPLQGTLYLLGPALCSYLDASKRRRVMVDSRAVSLMILSSDGGVPSIVC